MHRSVSVACGGTYPRYSLYLLPAFSYILTTLFFFFFFLSLSLTTYSDLRDLPDVHRATQEAEGYSPELRVRSEHDWQPFR